MDDFLKALVFWTVMLALFPVMGVMYVLGAVFDFVLKVIGKIIKTIGYWAFGF